MHYSWTQAPLVRSKTDFLKVLLNRLSLDNLQSFVKPQANLLRDPETLPHVDRAVTRIKRAIKNQELITVYGDYDCDGITSTTVMVENLMRLGARVKAYIPDRFRDGYGPNARAYQQIVKSGSTLIITVDNGVGGRSVIDPVQMSGIDVIVTDHHELPNRLPRCYAIVHPGLAGSKYGFNGLSGVGVAWKLCTVLLGRIPDDEYDLVALGEIADVMPMTDENRYIVKTGLRQLSDDHRLGVKMMINGLGLRGQNLTSIDVGFKIAPMLNALGRVDNAKYGVQLLLSADPEQAEMLARRADNDNQRRKTLSSQVTQAAMDKISDDPVQLIDGIGWHRGVLGLAAGRVVNQTGKPSIVVSRDSGDPLYVGSGRSRAGFDLYKALVDEKQYYHSFGGHPQACGLSLNQDQIKPLREILDKKAASQGFDQHAKPSLKIDVRTSLSTINSMDLYQKLMQLSPFGIGNKYPEIEIDGVRLGSVSRMGNNNQYAKAKLDGMELVMFNNADELANSENQTVDLAGTLGLNTFRGRQTLQLIVDDVREK